MRPSAPLYTNAPASPWRVAAPLLEWAGALALVTLAVARRDIMARSTRVLSLLTSLASVGLGLAIFYFIGELVQSAPTALLTPGAGGYFAFVVLGMTQAQLFSAATYGISQRVRTAQLEGTLEGMLATPAPPFSLMLATALPVLGAQVVRVIGVLGVAALFFDFPWRLVNWPATLVTLALSLAAFLPIGLLGATYVIMSKAEEPLSRALGAAAALLGGLYFPRAVLPLWLQTLGLALPITHAADALRATMLGGATLHDIGRELGALMWFAGVGLPIAAVALHSCVGFLRRRGSF